MAEEEFFGLFTTAEIPSLIEELAHLQAAAGRVGLREFANGVGLIVVGLLRDLNEVAREYAGVVDQDIRHHIEATRSGNRPATGELGTHIESDPGPLGSVGVAKLSELDRTINVHAGTWGPYWTAQEFGTGVTMEYGPFAGSTIPEQTGRLIFGTFYQSEEPPEAAQAGLGVGRDQYFLPMGSAPGLGRISVELPGRHFLRDGFTEAGAKYVRRMHEIQQRWINELNRLLAELEIAPGDRTFVGHIVS